VAGGAVAWRGASQPVAFLRRLARLPDAVEVLPEPGPGTVLAGEHGNDVDVIVSVADCDPADRVVVLPAWR